MLGTRQYSEPVGQAPFERKPLTEWQIEPAPHRELRYRCIFTGEACEPMRQFKRAALEFGHWYDFGDQTYSQCVLRVNPAARDVDIERAAQAEPARGGLRAGDAGYHPGTSFGQADPRIVGGNRDVA